MQKDETSSNHLNSSTSMDNDVYEIPLPDNSVTTVLHYCKRKILTPYMRFLSFMGLRPLTNESQESCLCLKILSGSYTVTVVLLMVVGYVLQYMACFRRDRGFYYVSLRSNDSLLLMRELERVHERTCEGSVLFSFAVPGLLHLAAYLRLLFVLRSTDDEQLPILLERVFLISTNLSTGFMSQRKLVRTLRFYVISGLLWMTLSFIVVTYLMLDDRIYFKWMKKSSPLILLSMKILLAICTLWHDVVQATVVSNYCLQAQLLTSYVQFMKEKLLQFPVQPLGWMRDIEDFKKLLNHFNSRIAPSVCLLTVIDITFALSGLLWIFKFDYVDKETMPIFGFSILNVILWTFISAVPFIQASRLSNSCEILRSVGQEARTRPYVHQDTPTLELDSVLLYTTSLKISAKLFHLPITGRKLCFCVTVASIILLTLGQCHYFISQ